MAQPMSIKEMIRVIDDVFGGSFEFTLWKPNGETTHRIEVKSLDEGGSEVGQFDIPTPLRHVRDRMKINITYALGELPFGVVQFIAMHDADFRDYIQRELEP